MATKFTIKGAQARIEELEGAINYLDMLLNEDRRIEAGVDLQNAPKGIDGLIKREKETMEKELASLKANVAHALEQLDLISLD